MSVVKATPKGQIVIPAPLRVRFGISGGSRVEVREENGRIVVMPLLRDPVRQGRGLLRKGSSALNALKKLREGEAKR